jgi:hypothetical protein
MRSIASLAALLAFATFGSGPSLAASHREAPLMALDPAADITDVYAFVGYDAANLARGPADRRVTLIMNVIPARSRARAPTTTRSTTTSGTSSSSTTTATASGSTTSSTRCASRRR